MEHFSFVAILLSFASRGRWRNIVGGLCLLALQMLACFFFMDYQQYICVCRGCSWWGAFRGTCSSSVSRVHSHFERSQPWFWLPDHLIWTSHTQDLLMPCWWGGLLLCTFTCQSWRAFPVHSFSSAGLLQSVISSALISCSSLVFLTWAPSWSTFSVLNSCYGNL